MPGIADRDVHLVGRDDAQFGITELPPELMADHGDIQRRRRFRRVLSGKNDACRSQEEHYDDQDGNHGPGKLDLGAPVDLRRLLRRVLVISTMAVTHQHKEQQPGDYEKYRGRDAENQHGKTEDGVRRRPGRSKDAGRPTAESGVRLSRDTGPQWTCQLESPEESLMKQRKEDFVDNRPKPKRSKSNPGWNLQLPGRSFSCVRAE